MLTQNGKECCPHPPEESRGSHSWRAFWGCGLPLPVTLLRPRHRPVSPRPFLQCIERHLEVVPFDERQVIPDERLVIPKGLLLNIVVGIVGTAIAGFLGAVILLAIVNLFTRKSLR